MLIDRSSPGRRKTAGVALVVTLALLVLVTVSVVAFFSRTTTNQQITSGSSQGDLAVTFADGATQEIIAGLQKEMWDTSGQPAAPTAPVGAPTILTPTTAAGSVPSRVLSSTDLTFPSGSAPDANAVYSQFGNLVKQSIYQKPIYTGGTSTTVSTPASNVPTTAAANTGRQRDGTYWNQVQLVSVPGTDTTTLNKYLVPNWIYTNRANSAPNDPNDRARQHPTVYLSGSGMEASPNGALGPNTIVGRYAYNIYDIGGLLNANVAGYDANAANGASTQPSYSSKATMIVPGYKGSALMADLTGLTLNGTLNLNGGSANVFAASNTNSLPKFRYPTDSNNPAKTWKNDISKLLVSGQYAGWLRPFLATYDPAVASRYGTTSNTALLENNNFTSRQDLISWVNSQLGGGTTAGTWALPYLTHFSYDVDAPSFKPNASRPRSNAALGATGGNDSSSTLDDQINPAFTAVLDANGYPLVKHRFPLSALSLLDNIYPGNVPADLLDSTSALYKQIQYDFGLVWNSTYNCWDYKDVDPGTYVGIKQLRTANNAGTNTVPNTRSPNFFELLKASLAAGSLGKQWGNGAYDGDPDNSLGAPRYSSINYQVVQIGANIISQTTTNYCPTAICLNRNGVAPIIYGIKDLPYFYRTRLLALTVDNFRQADTHKPMLDKNTNKYSLLAAIMVQPELWNPHAPNLLAPTANYPLAFRIVPETSTDVGVTTTSAGPGTQWQEGYGGLANPIGDYQAMGGPYCLPNLGYHSGASPDAYISFGWDPHDASNADLVPKAPDPINGSAIGSFRSPCPLASPTFPGGIKLSSFPINPTMAVGYRVQWDHLANTQITSQIPASSASGAAGPYQNVIPARFNTATPSNVAMGFLLAYCCTGPGTDLSQIKGMSGGPMSLKLQYSMDGTNFYTYDTIQSSFPDNINEFAPPSGVQQTLTGVRTDPRTHRWGMIWANIPYGQYVYGNGSYTTGQYDNQAGLTYSPSSNLGTTNYGTSGNQSSLPKAPGYYGTLNMTASPYALQMAWTQVNQSSAPGYYQDPDGVTRKADGGYVVTTNMTGASGSSASAVGLPEAMLHETGNSQATAPGITGYESRPVVLNRPFQSVAELGYVFRDTPWRSLDFFSPESGDNALLDVFCVYGPDPYAYMNTLTSETAVVAGKVNLNTRQQPVLAALIQGASTTTVFSSTNGAALTAVTSDQASKIAQGLVQWTTTTSDVTQGPLSNNAELVGKYNSNNTTRYSGFSSTLTTTLATAGSPAGSAEVIKQQRECVMHALADAGTTRTWNLLIDLVAQTGQLPANPAGLQSFNVTGERHVWVSVAIDRVTGKIIKMQAEPVRL
ncbi:MAG: hypothetical protein INR62_01605 [Rhodospirillales bacterium]|nr:hypothetical protein [Acetobacter sp.]